MDKDKITQREWDRSVGIGTPPELPEYELNKSTGEVQQVESIHSVDGVPRRPTEDDFE